MRFRNPWPHAQHGIWEIARWKCGLPPQESAVLPLASQTPATRRQCATEELACPPAAGWRVVWLGHASFLLQSKHACLLVDPMFSSYCAPVPLPSLRRLVQPPCRLDQLPPVDAVLLTHSHYDHLDVPTLRFFGKSIPLVVPAGHGGFLKKRGFLKVTEVPWFGRHEVLPGVMVTATPAQHFTARSLWDRNLGHWCGWRVEGDGAVLWHAGDSGYCEGFAEIFSRLGPADFGMIPIGAYQPRRVMKAMHMNPEEAVQAFLDAGCRRAVAMHWGTFRLTDEPLGEPPLRLQAELVRRHIPSEQFCAGAIGEIWHVPETCPDLL